MVRKQPPDDAVLLFFLRQQMSTTVVLILSRLSYVENYLRYRTSAVDAETRTPSHVGIGTTNAVGNVGCRSIRVTIVMFTLKLLVHNTWRIQLRGWTFLLAAAVEAEKYGYILLLFSTIYY